MSSIKAEAGKVIEKWKRDTGKVVKWGQMEADIEQALRDERKRAAKIADERAAFNRRLARGRINDTVDSRVADLKLTRADEAEVIAKEIREEVEP